MVAFSKLPFMISDEDIVDKRYENGKIYIVKCKYDNSLIYVGSTIKTLEERFSRHKYDKNCILYKYVNGDWHNWEIKLYENYPCKNKYILEKREGELQKKITNINLCIAGRSKSEHYQDNFEKLLNYQKQYRNNNSDKILRNKKKYYENNRDKILEKKKENTTCDNCGLIISKWSLSKHKKSKKCLNYNVDNN